MGNCQFCEQPLSPSPQKERKFCSSTCRKDFHEGCRLLGEDLYRAGAVDASVLRLHVRNAKSGA